LPGGPSQAVWGLALKHIKAAANLMTTAGGYIKKSKLNSG